VVKIATFAKPETVRFSASHVTKGCILVFGNTRLHFSISLMKSVLGYPFAAKACRNYPFLNVC
jgi:hypothetical protein